MIYVSDAIKGGAHSYPLYLVLSAGEAYLQRVGLARSLGVTSDVFDVAQASLCFTSH